ncbi:alpha-L-fucosidase [Pedobacter sp. GSP4]|uniref:alpha-L-fucosidase n=1 Tax=Pedobacter sp. GSP4 TaxID=3453716 RepID=UPI003EF0085A
MNFRKILLMLTVLVSVLPGMAQNKKVLAPNMAAFMDQRFGMFIHWGPVSLRGTEIGWSRDKQVSKEDYDNLYKEFNPVLFNADEWVKAAKDAGMKYLTITARHHDGFCLWPTKFTDYNIMNTPFKKDVVGALKKACDKQGIKFCIYYTILDWWHPEYPIHSAHNSTIDPKSDMNKYLAYMKNQLKELVTNYDPQMLWFDGGWEKPWTNEMGKEVYAYLKKLKPSLVVNNRLGKEMAGTQNKKIEAHQMVGDFDTPEQVVGRMNMDTPWESCFTICNQWAWKPNDKMKSLDECLSISSKTFGGNGNLLLNVGPMPDGRIEARQITRLKEIGDWLKINGSAVYGTLGGPYSPTDDYAATRKGNKVFLHIINTKKTEIELPNIPDRKINQVHTMQGENLKVQEGNNTFKITLPANLVGKTEYIVVLELNGPTESLAVLK